MEALLTCEVPSSAVGEHVLRGIKSAIAQQGQFGTVYNDSAVSGDRSEVRIAQDEYVFPDPLRGELPTAEFLRLLSEWTEVLRMHGQ
jgi:hypothetical protein